MAPMLMAAISADAQVVAANRSSLLDPVTLRAQLLATERDRLAQLDAQRAAAEKARAAAAEARHLTDQRVDAAATLRAADVAVADAAEQIADLAEQRDAAEARVQLRAADLAPLLPVLERLSMYPTETLIAVPQPPEDALRAVIVLKGVAGNLAAEAHAIRAEQAQVAHLSDQIAAKMYTLREAQAKQAALAADLDKQIAAARASGRLADDEAAAVARKAADEAARADTLRGALSQIAARQRAAEAAAREEAARATRARETAAAEAAVRRQDILARPAGPGLSEPTNVASANPRVSGVPVAGAPVAGRLLHGFGDPTAAGAAQGVSYEAAPGARVTAPCTGRAAFAGPFRSFGLLLILDCGGGYHFVLAGLDRLDVEVGRAVRANEPIGTMPAWDPSRSANRPALYVELRRGTRPIDPEPWLHGRS
jgi:septal ring factor EnvC (AmiA/AmiB activator)